MSHFGQLADVRCWREAGASERPRAGPFGPTLHLQKLDRGEVVASFQNFGTGYYGSDVIRKMYNGLLTKPKK